MRFRLRSLITALALLTMASCSNGGGSPAVDPGIAADASSGPAVAAEGEAFELLAQVTAAKDRAVISCMERKGFTVHPPAQKSDAPPPGGYPFRDPLTSAQAMVNGYPGIGEISAEPESSDRAAADDPFSRLPREEQNRYLAAIGRKASFVLPDGTTVGLIRGGCDEEVMVAIFGDLAKYLTLRGATGNMTNEVREQTEQDSRVSGALRVWSQCMRDKGYTDLATLDDAETLATSYYWPRGEPVPPAAQALPKEVKLASADAECSATSNVESRLQDVWLEHKAKYYKVHETDFVSLRSLLQTALINAQKLVQGK